MWNILCEIFNMLSSFFLAYLVAMVWFYSGAISSFICLWLLGSHHDLYAILILWLEVIFSHFIWHLFWRLLLFNRDKFISAFPCLSPFKIMGTFSNFISDNRSLISLMPSTQLGWHFIWKHVQLWKLNKKEHRNWIMTKEMTLY